MFNSNKVRYGLAIRVWHLPEIRTNLFIILFMERFLRNLLRNCTFAQLLPRENDLGGGAGMYWSQGSPSCAWGFLNIPSALISFIRFYYFSIPALQTSFSGLLLQFEKCHLLWVSSFQQPILRLCHEASQVAEIRLSRLPRGGIHAAHSGSVRVSWIL